MLSSSQVSDTVLPVAGGHHNKLSDPSAVSANDGPDVELYGSVFPQCQAESGKKLFYKNPVNVKNIELGSVSVDTMIIVIMIAVWKNNIKLNKSRSSTNKMHVFSNV